MTQGLLQLATTGTVSGLQNNQAANTALAALAGMIQGGSAPTPASTGLASTSGVWWHDTTNNQVKLRDQADANWMPAASVDETNKLVLLLLRSYLAGLTLSNDGTSPNTVIDVSAGVCADDTNVAMLNLPSGQTINGATTGAGGLDTGSLAASTWYHVFVIGKPGGGAGALVASTSLASPAFPTGYTLKRRIGSFKTDASAHILGFFQFGDHFYWKAEVQDQSTTLAATATNFTVSTPVGLQTLWLGQAFIQGTTANTGARLYSPSASDQVISPSSDAYSSFAVVAVAATSSRIGGTVTGVLTDTSSRIRAVSDATGSSFILTTIGWIDPRGRFT